MASSTHYQCFTEEQFINRGLELCCMTDYWRKLKLDKRTSEFVNEYTVHPRALAAIWRDLNTSRFAELRIDGTVKPEHLLLVYRWLSAYESEKKLRRSFDFGEHQIREKCRVITSKIAALRKIKIDPNWEDDDGTLLSETLDGIHYKIDEPRPFSRSFGSHKEGMHACLDYEFCIYAHKDKIAWLNGPYPAGTPDGVVFRDKLKAAIEKKQTERTNEFRVIADDGYFAEDLMNVLSFRNEFDPREVAYFKDCALSRHERFNGLTKNYKILKVNFRHDRGDNPNREFPRHKAVVEAICVTLQYEFDLGVKNLFDPYP